MLSPFLQESLKSSNSLSEKLVFHMAVMRWKVNALTAEELTALNLWIDEQQKSKEQARMLPWMQEADEHDDLLFAENAHIQRYVTRALIKMADINKLRNAAILMTFHQRYRQRLRKLSDTQVLRLCSSSGALNPRRAVSQVTCKYSPCTPLLILFSLMFFLATSAGGQWRRGRHSMKSTPR